MIEDRELSLEDEIVAEKEILETAEHELLEIPGVIKDAEIVIASCDEKLLQVSSAIEEQRKSLTLAASQLHDATLVYNSAKDYADVAVGKAGEHAAINDLKEKKALYEATKLIYQKEQQAFDQASAKYTDLQDEYGSTRTQAQALIDGSRMRERSLQSARLQAEEKLGNLLYRKSQERVTALFSSLEEKEKQIILAEEELQTAIEEESVALQKWPHLQASILCTLPYTDSCTLILERFQAFLELLLQERNMCNIEPGGVKERFHNFDMSLLLELSQADISAALSDPLYGLSPARLEEKLQDVEKLLQVYRNKH